MNTKVFTVSFYLGLFLIVTAGSWFLFKTIMPVNGQQNVAVVPGLEPTATPAKSGYITFSGPKTAVCPINGELHTAQEQQMWSQRRPLEVMIENHQDARPESGLQNADIVYEAVAEGGITRFMGVFYCNVLKGSPNTYDVGPVRSARTYFLDLASEYGDYPLYAHVGGANCSGGDSASAVTTNCTSDPRTQALEQINSYGWTNQGTWGDLNQFSLPYKACRREYERTGTVKATEHTMYCSTTELWNIAASRGLTNLTQAKNTSWDKNYRSWQFKSADTAAVSTAQTISFDFWPGYKQYSVSWAFDAAKNNYLRSNGGDKFVDFNTGSQVTAKDVIIQFVKETQNVDEHKHNLYGVIGTGKGVFLHNGQKEDVTWSKASRTARTVYKDAAGKEINFTPGLIWVELLPIGNTVTYAG